jgi:glucose-6-phosphate 1-dehydrogenase
MSGTEEFRTHLWMGIEQHAAQLFDATARAEFSTHLWYRSGEFEAQADYDSLETFLRDEVEGGPANRLFYLATTLIFFTPIFEQLGAYGMARQEDGWRLSRGEHDHE